MRIFLALVLCVAAVSAQVEPAPECTDAEREKCTLPNCRCSGVDIPGGLQPEETPQLVFLTYDDAVVTTNFPFYKDELTERKNPNGHPISATFFISHEYTDYPKVNELYIDGHDIALHSISHDPYEDYWGNGDGKLWREEVVDQKRQIITLAAIPNQADVQGMRAPHLKGGGDVMYQELYDAKFVWENSRPTLAYRPPDGMWPYTNDYLSTQDCKIEPCPIGAYPGFWTVPLIDLLSSSLTECAMADACTPVLNTTDQTFEFLQTNFLEHYNGNRVPFELSIHAGWVNGTGNETIAERRKGYDQFLDYLATLPDVYLVSISRGLEWVKNPTPISGIKEFTPFHAVNRGPSRCTRTYSCKYTSPKEIYMESCIPCPRNYPWVGNPIGS